MHYILLEMSQLIDKPKFTKNINTVSCVCAYTINFLILLFEVFLTNLFNYYIKIFYFIKA